MTKNSNFPVNTTPIELDQAWKNERKQKVRSGAKLILVAALCSLMSAFATAMLLGNIQIVYAANGPEFVDAAAAAQAEAAPTIEVAPPAESLAVSEQESDMVAEAIQTEESQAEEAEDKTEAPAESSTAKVKVNRSSSKGNTSADSSETLDKGLTFIGVWGGQTNECTDGTCGNYSYDPDEAFGATCSATSH